MSRFVPNSFQHNGRVASALLPCLATAAVIGGTPVVVSLTVGAMVCYMMDALQYREGTFTCTWLTLGIADAAFIYSLVTTSEAPAVLTVAMVFAMGAVVALAGGWRVAVGGGGGGRASGGLL